MPGPKVHEIALRHRRLPRRRPARKEGRFGGSAGPRLSGLELARRAARRHAVDGPEVFVDEPDDGERVVVVRPWRYGRLYVVEE